jgi:uncharacterized protein (DUF362 family)
MALSRRSFLLGGAGALAGATAARCLPGVDGQWRDESQALCSASEPRVAPGDPAQRGRVLELHDPALTVKDAPVVDAKVAAAGFKQLLLALSGKPDVAAAWATLFPALAPGQVIGIKVNTLNQHLSTHPEVVRAVVDSLRQGLAIAPEQIVVWDRRLDELTRAGLTPSALGVSVEGTLESTGAKGAGRGYELKATCLGLRNAKLSNILTRRIDHLINIAVMKRHEWSGFTACLKNHYGSIDNPGDFHDKVASGGAVLERRFEAAIPALNALPEVVGKTRLWIVDASFGVAKGSTDSPVDCIPNRLLCGLDPLALDVRARQLRDEMRGALGPDPETVSEGWLQAAERAGLGSRAPRLEQVKG